MSTLQESLSKNKALFPKLSFEPTDRGWLSSFPGEDVTIFGNKVIIDFQTKEVPEDFPYIPPIKEYYVELFHLIANNLDEIISTVCSKATELAKDQKALSLLTVPVVWINDDYYDSGTWTFVLKSVDEEEMLMFQFFELELTDAW